MPSSSTKPDSLPSTQFIKGTSSLVATTGTSPITDGSQEMSSVTSEISMSKSSSTTNTLETTSRLEISPMLPPVSGTTEETLITTSSTQPETTSQQFTTLPKIHFQLLMQLKERHPLNLISLHLL